MFCQFAQSPWLYHEQCTHLWYVEGLCVCLCVFVFLFSFVFLGGEQS